MLFLPEMLLKTLLATLVFVPGALAFFRLPCDNVLVHERADPIVSPGKVAGHAHTISGGSGFSLNSSARTVFRQADALIADGIFRKQRMTTFGRVNARRAVRRQTSRRTGPRSYTSNSRTGPSRRSSRSAEDSCMPLLQRDTKVGH